MPARPDVDRSIRIVEGGAQAPLRHARHRPRRARLLRAAPEGLRGRLGPQADEHRPPPARCCPATRRKSIPGLEFWTVKDHSLGDIWRHSPAFNAYRGTDWMPEPCRSCERKGDRLGRLSLPGARAAARRRGGDGPGLRQVAVPRQDRGAGDAGGGDRSAAGLRVSRARPAGSAPGRGDLVRLRKVWIASIVALASAIPAVAEPAPGRTAARCGDASVRQAAMGQGAGRRVANVCLLASHPRCASGPRSTTRSC